MRPHRPSATAHLVARNLLYVHRTKELERFVPADAARLSRQFIQAYSAPGEAAVNGAPALASERLFRFYERLTIPGLALHQALRKRYIEQQLRAHLAEGFEQVVVLGGGLDSLAVRLQAEFTEVNFIELDHPATQSIKREVIESRALAGDNFKLVPVDLTEASLAECLAGCSSYRSEARTVFLCEGVLMYLDDEEVNQLFNAIAQQARAPRFIFTFMEPDEQGRTSFRNSTWLVRLWLAWRGEPFKWGLHRAEASRYLQARGFRLRELATDETLRELYLRPHGLDDATLAEGENICVCEPQG
jgi:methyltransferase (TIGR00027 family)